MDPTDHGDAQKTIDEIKQEFLEYLKNFPDFDSLISTGTLRAVGGGWYEMNRGTLPEGVGKYLNLRVRGGKPQFKPVKLTKDLKALKDKL